MQNKSLFILLAITLFIIAGVAGYFGPALFTGSESAAPAVSSSSFVPPSVPKRRSDAFAGQFDNMQAATEGKSLPEDAFIDLKGKNHRFADFRGKPLLVNFWATWCLPCVVELPSLQSFANHYRDQIGVVAIALEPGKTAEELARFLEIRQIGAFAAYQYSDPAIDKKLELRGIPTSFLVGSDGLILYRFEGEADWESPESKAFFDTILLQNR